MPLLDNTKQARENLLRELSSLSDMTPEKIDPILKRTEEAFGIEFKKKVVWMVVALFAFSLGFLWLGLWWIATEEYSLLHSKPPVVKSPIITERLLLALIAGTVTQISVAFIFMVRYLFGSKKTD